MTATTAQSTPDPTPRPRKPVAFFFPMFRPESLAARASVERVGIVLPTLKEKP